MIFKVNLRGQTPVSDIKPPNFIFNPYLITPIYIRQSTLSLTQPILHSSINPLDRIKTAKIPISTIYFLLYYSLRPKACLSAFIFGPARYICAHLRAFVRIFGFFTYVCAHFAPASGGLHPLCASVPVNLCPFVKFFHLIRLWRAKFPPKIEDPPKADPCK